MAISIKREKNNPEVPLGSLSVGDTFLYDNRVGVLVERNGHTFPVDLTTCGNFRVVDPQFWKMSDYKNGELAPSALVVPVSVELTYKVMR